MKLVEHNIFYYYKEQHHKKRYGYLLRDDGTINPEISSVVNILSLSDDYGPLFKDPLQQRLHEEPENALKLITGWHTEWKTQYDEKMNPIKGLIDGLTADGWEKERLFKLIQQRMDSTFWYAGNASRNRNRRHLARRYEERTLSRSDT